MCRFVGNTCNKVNEIDAKNRMRSICNLNAIDEINENETKERKGQNLNES